MSHYTSSPWWCAGPQGPVPPIDTSLILALVNRKDLRQRAVVTGSWDGKTWMHPQRWGSDTLVYAWKDAVGPKVGAWVGRTPCQPIRSP